ncbi:vacuole membrane protein 1-like [Paramacrobiotus metropolitanus]|uniref:vacuole membrane protein 1-like n=1 Tax=Paramacrobiotus metropolitanus TaxID=2943436 RepID=UPI002445B4DB|nr:vacuole membrane protein 1-like [Paramacrobiotus metropolitanus]XP_055348600.1 vacuole membrane protein 1-like [Paramacrobiotus metropolitanus]
MVSPHSPSSSDFQRVTRSKTRLAPSDPSDVSPPAAASAANSGKARKRKMKAAQSNGSLPSPAASVVTVETNGSVRGSKDLLAVGSGSFRPRLPSSASFEERRKRELEVEEDERKKITLFRSPLMTVYYFVMEVSLLVREFGTRLIRSNLIIPFALLSALVVVTYNIQGPHQWYYAYAEKKLLVCLYWIGLGVLSSIGLGTGLHTFILYLGPHIASVTLAAYECGTLKFPEPPYPDEILCPEGINNDVDFVPSLWNIMSKVRLESFMWGLGTAIGELPPYFMARAARLSGREPEELLELQALLESKEEKLPLTIKERATVFLEELVLKVGFFGILLGASIPNPLFDLAGITCGHFLVPFSTFFGATLIGKAVIKMHIQMIFVIITFSERHVEHIINSLKHIPRIGPYLETPFVEFLRKQKSNLHRQPGTGAHQTEQSWLQWGFEKLVLVMVLSFILSIINSLAQNYHRRLSANATSQKGKLRE